MVMYLLLYAIVSQSFSINVLHQFQRLKFNLPKNKSNFYFITINKEWNINKYLFGI